MNELRVLHCPTLTGGHSFQLAQAERNLGLASYSAGLSQNYLQYKVDQVLSQSPSLLKQQIELWKLLITASRNYSVVHYNAGSSILPHRFSSRHAQRWSPKWGAYKLYCWFARIVESAILSRKLIAVTFQGDDARQGDFCLENYTLSIAHRSRDYYTPEKNAAARSRIEYFSKHADLIYAQNPDLLRVLPKRARFLPYCCSIRDQKLTYHNPSRVPIVVHAPSNRQAKGTHYVIDAVRRLNQQGFRTELQLVEGLSHSEALIRYARADLVVDQLLVGWYGNFATEAMALGKPVVCYIRPEDLKLIPDQMAADLPIINADPGTLYSVLKRALYLRNETFRQRGLLGLEYVKKWHDPTRIARGVIADYQMAAIRKLGRSYSH